jgi:hypothetical protein
MNNLVKHIPGFMNAIDSANVYMYATKHDNLFLEYGNNEKEFTYHSDIIDQDIKNILDQYGKEVWDFVSKNYDGNFIEFDSSKTHMARFEEGYGMHEHFDSNKPNDIATLIYINDNYDGGDIYFPDLNISIKPAAGDLVCFPDTPDFVHGVRPITKGIRYTSPRWITRLV